MYKVSDTSDGKHILRKIIHDTLDCITSYEECMRIIQPMENELYPESFYTLATWKREVSNWRSEILLLTKYIEEHPETSTNWMMVIEKIRLIIEKSSDFKIAMQSVIAPENNASQQLVEIAIRQSMKLELISQALKAQDYEKLRITHHW